MSYDYGTFHPNETSTKKLLFIFVFIVLGVFIILAIFVFLIKNLIREEVSAVVKILRKSDGIWVIETADHPRGINNCIYNVGDTVVVKYKEGISGILSHKLKQ